jgi:hypothetical protein
MNDRALRAVFRAIGRDICAGRGPARALQAVCFRGNGGVPQGPDQWHGGRSGGVSKAGRGRRRRCTRRPSRLVATNADGPQPEGADDEAQGSGRAVRRNGSSDPGGFTAAHTCPTGIFVPVAGRLTNYWACRSRCVPNNASETVARAASRLWVGVRGSLRDRFDRRDAGWLAQMRGVLEATGKPSAGSPSALSPTGSSRDRGVIAPAGGVVLSWPLPRGVRWGTLMLRPAFGGDADGEG